MAVCRSLIVQIVSPNKRHLPVSSYSFTLLILCFTIHLTSYSQSLTQSVRGKITNEAGSPVKNGSVFFVNDSVQAGASTDTSGSFKIEAVPVGRHTIGVKALGYKDVIVPGVVVDAGKEAVLNITLHEMAEQLDEVEITAMTQTGPSSISARTFTVEETQRMAATFYDPARLAASFPGVVSDNDQANNIVIRGNSPNGLLWRVEGLDIVNPNHLDNAGTFSDRAALNGGGVNILSGQLLDASTFITGAFAAGYGNALSGVFDMRLRNGNNEHREYIAQASLLGIDLAAEGPFAANKKSSYLVNYRYSTIGLLSAMGVNFGNEITSFQDLSFNLTFPTQKAGTFTLFGMGGLSDNHYNAVKDSSLWEYSRDRYDVDFYSKMGAVGVTHKLPIKSRAMLSTGAALSGKMVQRRGNYINDNYDLETLQSDDHLQQRASVSTSLTYYFKGTSQVTAGVITNSLNYDVFTYSGSESRSARHAQAASASYHIIQPFTNFKWGITSRLTINTGLHYNYLTLNNSQSLEPRASLLYDLGKGHSATLAYGMHSQVQQPGVYFTSRILPDDRISYPNKQLGFTKAHHYVAGYTARFRESFTARTEAYYQQLYNVPVSTDRSSSFSMLNVLETIPFDSLVSEGRGENYGMELSVEKFLFSKYYFLISATVYDSKYAARDGIWRNTRYNGKYAFSFTGGREFQRSRNRVLGLNLRTIYRGGYPGTPIDPMLSEVMSETVYSGDPFSVDQKDYFRIDVRFSSKKHRARYTRIFAIDIQNLTNTRNAAYNYYDTLRGEVTTKYQLGLIPVLSYRIEFSGKKSDGTP